MLGLRKDEVCFGQAIPFKVETPPVEDLGKILSPEERSNRQ